MTPAWVAGLGLWAPGFASAAAWASGAPDAAVTEPAAALLPARLGRRASLLTRMAAEVLQQAGGAPSAQVPAVYATAYGETQNMAAILDSLCTDGTCSPARFHHSVHNTAGGLLSIATSNRAFSTTVCAGPDTAAMALLEAFGLLQQRGGEVFAVIAEEAPPVPFAQGEFAPAAAALRLSLAELPGAQQIRLVQATSGTRLETPPAFANNPIAVSLALVEALHLRRAGVFLLPGGWAVETEPVRKSG